MTQASLVSQAMKGSWETIWALIDGNYQTGNFGPLWERLDPSIAYHQIGYAPLFDPKITFIFFGLVGLVGIWRKKYSHTSPILSIDIIYVLCILLMGSWDGAPSGSYIFFLFCCFLWLMSGLGYWFRLCLY